MTDFGFILAGWLGTAAVLASYVGWLRARTRRVHPERQGIES